MYWLVGGLIIVVMMGVLAVADSMPSVSSLVDTINPSVLALILVVMSLALIMLSRLYTPATPAAQSTPFSSQTSSQSPVIELSITKRLLLIARHIVVVILAAGLIGVSALQALVSHQQAESSKITEPLRVQALVTIEGISDSVLDAAADTGYRQVAVITHLSPLVSELTSQDLDNIIASQLAGIQSNNNENSLSINSNSINLDTLHTDRHRILLSAYPQSSRQPKAAKQFANLSQLKPGETRWMSLALSPLATAEQATSSPSGFDSYRWLRGRHIDGVARVLATATQSVSTADDTERLVASSSLSHLSRVRTYIDRGRWQLRQHFYQGWHVLTGDEQQAKAVTLSLLTGDRSLINRETKELYQLAGISHLLAISGTHVLFLAIVLAGAAVMMVNQLYPALYRYVPRWQVRWWVMIGAAFVYALFTGFDVPAARTAWMLFAIGLMRLSLLPISTTRVLLALAVLMAWRDPYVLWQAGYWLSFVAVALLLQYEDRSHHPHTLASTQTNIPSSHQDKAGGRLWLRQGWGVAKRVFKLQFWLFIALLPITLLLFGKASLWGLIINIFAIGLFGWVIVPLNLLAGLIYLLSPTLADDLWTFVTAIILSLHQLIGWLTTLPALSAAWLYTPINMAIVLMMVLVILPWLLPRGFISRGLALPPLMLLMMTVYANQQSLMAVPTLYLLPTGDQYISASVLQYPMTDDSGESGEDEVSWLFLADHRPSDAPTMPSRLTAEALSATVAQQLGSLSIQRLHGVVVQSSSAALSQRQINENPPKSLQASTSELLPLTVLQLSQHLPTYQYWQAGRIDRWPALQAAYQVTHPTAAKSSISAQRCEEGKTWQSANKELSITAMTGWRQIEDASVWDCTIAIDLSGIKSSRMPIQVLRYNAAAPLKSSAASVQAFLDRLAAQPSDSSPPQRHTPPERIILNADSHARVWQLWSLMCTDERAMPAQSRWLGHSTSSVTADVLERQRVGVVITHDDKILPAALPLETRETSMASP
ncbi:ComEC/Rec2 family competence protein [Psychrobacter celer]|uniref:ComEC/Rec2 family competence protein n=1 Tax=Psychrobacter celer TaxID=306572 RepID=UPI003FD056DC